VYEAGLSEAIKEDTSALAFMLDELLISGAADKVSILRYMYIYDNIDHKMGFAKTPSFSQKSLKIAEILIITLRVNIENLQSGRKFYPRSISRQLFIK
jgi:hypothetical protein